MKKQKHLKTIEKRLLVLLLCTSMIVTTAPATARAENEDVNATTAPADTSNQETLDIITTWQWNDEEDILDPETGSLSLPGASEQTPAYFDDVTALLPTQILATVVNAEEPITLGDWECDNYPEEGAYTGSYTFTATLPEGYALSEEAEALEVLVELGGAQTYESAESETVGAFTVTGGTQGEDYTYAGGVLTIKKDTSITIKNTDPSEATTDRIEVADGVSANITLAGVNIDVSSSYNIAAFKIEDYSSGNVTITLADDSENTLKSGEECAGLQKNGDCGTLTIKGGTSGTGRLTAIGGNKGAGSGGGFQRSGSNITISGGTVTVTGGDGGAGIGGGYGFPGSNITISGGSVRVVAGEGANAIGGGTTVGAVTPTNGTDPVYLLTIENPNNEEVYIDGVSYTPVNHKAADGTDTNLYAYLSGKSHLVKVGEKTSLYIFDSENSTFAVAPLTVYPTNGGTLTYGTDYTYADSALTIKTDTSITIANTDPSTATTDRIEVEGGISANITLAGVNIDVSSSEYTAAFKIADNSTGNVTITLADGSENKLISGYYCAGLQKNGSGESIGELTIQGSTGTLTATGGSRGAGIGGGKSGTGLNIKISGGTVIATGGYCGAGIGGGDGGSGSNITISGGIVTATGGSYGAGIGGGYMFPGSDITISGGSVRVVAGEYANAIGGGESGNGEVTPKNGTNEVYLLTIANSDSEDIFIDGVSYTPVNHKAVDSNDTNLYAYLTGNTHMVEVGERTSLYIFDSENSTFAVAPLTVSATNGDTLTYGTDYTYAGGVLTIKTETPVTIKNTDPSTATTDRIEVASGVSANITLAGVNIDVSSLSETAAFKIADNSTGNVTITLADGSENTLKSCRYYAGLQKNGAYISNDEGKLTIQGGANGTGKLTAIGGIMAAGIGGSYQGSGSNIIITGGTVTANGDSDNSFGGTGIGGGCNGSGSNITISGGTVTANGGGRAAGIGGGNGGSGSNITISGGTVTANGGGNGAGIGGGNGGSGSNITISGGTVTANGGYNGAGIGGGNGGSGSDGSGKNITISGGTVTAIGGYNGAGIGGGCERFGVVIKITGGSVKAAAGSGANAIGGGLSGNGAVTPTSDGTTPVYLLEIANNSGVDITINNNAYPAEHTYYDFESSQYVTEKKIYAYLPAKTVEAPNVVKVGTETTKYIYDNSKWLIVSTGAYDVDGFCTNYEWKDGSLVLKDGIADGHTDCNGYEPATDNNSDDVYEIGNAGQLYWFADKVNTDNANYGSAKAVLTDNIAVNERILLNGELNTSESGSFRSWTPIGNEAKQYTGTFDGQGYTVSGLYVNDVDKKNVGLFGATGSSGKISNVGVVDSYFNGKNTVGGVCGLNKNGTIENCYNKSYVSGTENIGGVCGYNYAAYSTATIKNCHNEGKVSGSDYVGGVCGFNNDDPEGVATIEYCYNTGEVSSVYHVGGVCGWNRSVHGSSEIANCYNMGKVSGTNYVGGVCGYNYSNGGMSGIRKSFNTGKVGGTGDAVGGVCGLNSQESGASATVTNCYYIAGCNTEDTRFTCEEGTSKTATWFASGEATYLLNDSSSENPVWYQNIDRDGETADAYPVLDSNHGTVYQCTPCTAVYSNTPDKTVAHIFHVDENDSTKHTCEKCGYSEAHSTTNFSYSADEGTNRITVYCNEGGCDANIGYVELAAPSGIITYNGTEKEATVSDTVGGVDFSTTPITYKQGGNTLLSAPKDAGTYTASITLGTGAATVSEEFTIGKATPTISWDMLHGTTWIEITSMTVNYTGSEIAPDKLLIQPTVTLVNSETYNGEISYSYRVQGSSDDFTSGLPTDLGIYEVKASIVADGNYTAAETTGTMMLTVAWLNTTAVAVLTNQNNATLSGNDWWAQSVTFTAPTGFTISNSVDGTYGMSFVYDTQTGTDGTTVTYYLKNSDGEIAQKTATVRIDRTAPTWPADGGISIKNNWWKSLLNTISFGLFYQDATLDVKASATDSLSGVAAYYYYVDETGSTTVLSSDVLDTETFTKVEGSGEHTLTSLGSEGSYVVYAYAVDAVGNKSDYVCTNGVVLDTTAPTIRDITTPSKEALTLTDTSAKISFTGSEAGNCFYMIKKSDETAPASIDDFATSDTDSQGMTVWTAKTGVSSVEMTTEAKQITLSNLSPNTTYTLYLAAVDKAGNSIATVESKTFTTCKTMPTITKNPTISGTYGQTVADMTLTPGTAKVGSTVITGTWVVTDSNKTAVPGVGTTATYQVTFTPDSNNYDTVIVPVKPTVSKRVITVTADDKTKTYGQANPELTFTITEGELVSGDDNTALGITLTCAANASSPVKAGGYAITGTTNSANYQVTVIPGVLTIEKATPTITASNYTKTYGDIKFFLDATDSSAEASLQYAVTESKDPSASPVEKDAVVTVDARGYVTIIGAGTAKITASLPETTNYNAASKEIAIVVNQAAYPPNRPGTAMFVSNSCTHVGDVPLTGDWEWQNGDTVLRPGENDATAVYIGADKVNYEYTTAGVSITKSHDCDHVAGEILYTENGDYAPTCTTAGRGHRECTICGELIESGILVNPAHSFSSTWTIDVPATTTSEGSKSHHCTREGCEAKNDITVIPKLVISGGGDSGSSSSGSATTETPAVEGPAVEAPATNKPNTTKKPAESKPDTEAPFIKGDNGKEGWDVIRDEVKGTTEGSTVVVDMNGASVVPGDVIADIRGKDITLVFDMGNGITWSINGKSITSDQIGDINFSVTVGSSNIPVDVINNVTGERYSQQISLAYDGEFGFTAVLSINMDKKNAGLFANLFYYNEGTGELEFICADEIAADGIAELTFTHASEYTIVVDTVPMDGSAQALEETEEEGTEASEATVTEAPKEKGGLPWWIILVCAIVIVAGVGVFFVVRKKTDDLDE